MNEDDRVEQLEPTEHVELVEQVVHIEQDENYLDVLVHYAIEHPDKLSDIYFIKSLVKDADFIIFYYIEAFREKHAKLTHMNLQAAMDAHKLDWVNPKSVFFKKKGSPEVSKAYIASMTNENLVTQHDYANVLEKAVIGRYEEIMQTKLIDEDKFNVLRDQAVSTGNVLFTREVFTEITPLLEGTVPYLVFNGIKYGLKDSLAYIQAKLSYYNRMMIPDEMADYNDSISRTLANAVQALTPTFAFNLGRSIFSNPQAGFLVSVVAAEKIGKTRFVVGEMVFPTLMLGKNVLYLSGEMQPIQILTLLLVKFMFTKGKIIPEEIVENLLVCINRINQGIATEAQMKYFDGIQPEIKEQVILAQHELFFSGKYGKIIIRHISDSISINGRSKYFNIEEYFPLVREEIDSLPKEERYAMIVRDHVNHVSSISGASPVQTVTSYLQEAKTLATDKKNPLVYVVINHITTELARQIEEQGNVDGLKLRGHNSNEEGKTADLQMFLYERPGQRREGEITAVIENDRFYNMEQTFKTKEFIMKARREISDFVFFGERKGAYPKSEGEFLDFLEQNKRG